MTLPIRTFHPRRGRIGTGAADALARLWDQQGFTIDGRAFDRDGLFGRRAPLVLEIGSGMGDATLSMAAADPDRDYLAVDVHTPGLGALLAGAEAAGLTNIRAARGDALELLADHLGSGELDAIHLFFPDPWPKARHHKRRIISPERVALMRDRLRVGGTLHAATDWADYAADMVDVLGADPHLRGGPTARPAWRPMTKYERRGIQAGRTIHDLIYIRTAAT
ncbi:MAG TPA: tRNA (guanosine(46)-N7)-methyltransferase TrmB, partial [Micromonosporaceae bacterium]